MKQVIRYECEFCGKDFRTPKRHQCKYDPRFKNCYSCKHNKGFYKEDRGDGYGTDIIAECDKDYCDFNALEASGDLQCAEYEYCGGKWYENEHAKTKTREEEKKLAETIKDFDMFNF